MVRSSLSRRGFLAAFGAGAGAALDPERLLWVPGARVFSVPAPRVMRYSFMDACAAQQDAINAVIAAHTELLFLPLDAWLQVVDTINLRVVRRPLHGAPFKTLSS